MKYSVLALFLLVIAGALIAGCTQGPAPAAPVSTTAMLSSVLL
jgi:outer membrane lipoprotein-sorting protein